MANSLKFALSTACILVLYFGNAAAQDSRPDYAESFEKDLFNTEGGTNFEHSVMKRFDITRYKSLELTWHGKSKTGEVACLVYHGELRKPDGGGRKETSRNIAVKLAREKSGWVVNAYNIKPGKDPEAYDGWLKAHKCRDQ